MATVRMLSKGSRQILMSSEVADDLERRAKAVAMRAGDGFEAESSIGRTRALASVIAATPAAQAAEANDRVLLKALDAAR